MFLIASVLFVRTLRCQAEQHVTIIEDRNSVITATMVPIVIGNISARTFMFKLRENLVGRPQREQINTSKFFVTEMKKGHFLRKRGEQEYIGETFLWKITDGLNCSSEFTSAL